MITLRIHYLINGKARCGNPLGANWTVHSDYVTCATCKRLMSRETQ